MSAKTPIAFVVGTLLGAAGTWVVSAKYFNKKCEDDIQAIKAEFEQLHENDQESIKRLEKTVSDLVSGNTVEEDDTTVYEPVKASKKAKKQPKTNIPETDEPVDYTAFSKSNKGIPAKADPNIKTGKESDKKAKKEPYVIDYRDYLANDGYDKKLLRYFNNDDLFLDEEGDIESAGFKIVGKRNINMLVNETEGEIYIRNEELRADYNVLLEMGAYADYIEASADYDEDEEE